MQYDSIIVGVVTVLISFALIGGCTKIFSESNRQSTEIEIACIKEGGQYTQKQCVRVAR